MLKSPQNGFTAWHPANGNASDTMRFTNVVTGAGTDYDPSTGNFTCKVPGLYFFALSLNKKHTRSRLYDSIGCSIRKNRKDLVTAYLDPTDDYTDTGSYETSNFVVVNLDLLDVIDVGRCTETSTAYAEYSSFSGFLLHVT